MAELADARDLKSRVPNGACGFESRLGYLFRVLVVSGAIKTHVFLRFPVRVVLSRYLLVCRNRTTSRTTNCTLERIGGRHCVVLHRDCFSVAEPIANIFYGMRAEQFSLSTCSHVMDEFRPRCDSCLLQRLLKRSPDILILRSPASDNRITNRAVDAGLRTIVKVLQKWPEFWKDRAESNSAILMVLCFIGMNR